MVTNHQIQFPTNVAKENMKATVEELANHPIYTMYKVQFSDGYEDNFYWDEDLLCIQGVRPESRPYAEAINDDIMVIRSIDTNRFHRVFRYSLNTGATNIWVSESNDESGNLCYKVYYNGSYRFRMKELDVKGESLLDAQELGGRELQVGDAITEPEDWVIDEIAADEAYKLDQGLVEEIEDLLAALAIEPMGFLHGQE